MLTDEVTVWGRGAWGSGGFTVTGRIVERDGTRVLVTWTDENVSRRVWFHGTGRAVSAKHREEGLCILDWGDAC